MMAVATSPGSVCSLALQKMTTQIKKFKQRWIKLCDFFVTQHFKRKTAKMYSDHMNHWAPYTIKITWPIRQALSWQVEVCPIGAGFKITVPILTQEASNYLQIILGSIPYNNFQNFCAKLYWWCSPESLSQCRGWLRIEVDKNIAHLDSNLYSRSKTHCFNCSSPSCSLNTPCHYSPHTTSLKNRVVANDHNLLLNLEWVM